MKIIYTEEKTLIEYLTQDLKMKFDKSQFYNEQEYTWAINRVQHELSEEYERKLCILAKAYKLENFYDLYCTSEDLDSGKIEIKECDIYTALKQLANKNFLEGHELDLENTLWDYFDFEEFRKNCREFYSITECDFNGKHYVLIGDRL